MALLVASAPMAYAETAKQYQQETHSIIQARARLANSGQLRHPDDKRTATDSLSLDPESVPVFGARVIDATFSGHSAMLGSLDPTKSLRSPLGHPLFAMSTGEASGSSPAPGTAFESHGDTPDTARLLLTLEPEQGQSLLFVTWNLFTTEIPSFSALGFDDVFSIYVVDLAGRRKLVEVASSDDRMFPVSNSRAAGIGFDLYAHNPAILPADYGSGDPAAWMSGWRTTGFSIDSNGPVALEIEVRDGLDGLMDTQLLIEQITLSAMIPAPLAQGGTSGRGGEECVSFANYCEALFPLPGTFTGTGNPQDPPRVCEFDVEGRENIPDLNQPNEFRGTVFQSVVADGVTRMWLAPIFDAPRDEVEITLVDAEVPVDGGLGELGSFDRLESITVPVVQLNQNQWFGQAQFFAPQNYFKESLTLPDDYGPARRLQVQFCFQNAGGADRLCRSAALQIVRPDVVLMHGLWSGSEEWDLPLEDETSIDEVKTADYRATNASSFAENRFEPQKAMFDLCVSNFSRNIVGAQVDYAGHSMGGNLARVYLAQAAPYKTIHRLYTLNTPHLGSPLANLLVDFRDNLSPLKRFLLILAADRIGKSINRGAIDDLAVGSDALAAIPDTGVLSHALVGIGGSQWAAETLADAPGPIGDVYRILDFLTGPGDLFEGLQHDLVVGRDSQIGGLPLGTFTIFDGPDSRHTNVIKSPEHSERLFCPVDSNGNFLCTNGAGSDLINAEGTGQFAFFPSPSSVRSAAIVPPRISTADTRGGELIEGGMVISSPANGQIVAGGSSITVTVEPVAPFEAQRVMLLSEFDVSVLEQGPFEFEFAVPEDHVGALSLSAMGEDALGNFATTESVGAMVETPASLVSIDLSPDEVFLNGFDDRRNLRVTGQYDDGISRPLTDPSTGTVYTSVDPSIVTVSEAGVLRPRSDGVTTVIAGNGDLQDSMTVEVLNIGDLLFRDGFEP